MDQACAGIRVLDFSYGAAAPIAGALVAEFGAEVFRVSPPQCCDASRQDTAPRLTDGEKRLLVDLGSERGCAIARCLVSTADVALFSDPKERLARIGLDAVAARVLNPRLIHATMTSAHGALSGSWVDQGRRAASMIAAAVQRRGASGCGQTLVFALAMSAS
jgi:formyl-CoA transferase